MRLAQWRSLLVVAVVGILGTAGVARAQCGPMDVVFAQDTTGSMGGTLANITADLPKIISAIQTASGGDYKLGLVEIGGPQDGIIVHQNLTAGNAADIEKTFSGFTAGGGAGEPEASDEAINTILNNFKASDRPSTCGGPCQVGDFTIPFRASATKVIILITDARPSGYDDMFDSTDEAQVQKLGALAGSKGVHIGAIFVPTPASAAFGVQDTVVRIMQEWASLSGGIYLRANSDGTGTSTAIDQIIASCGGAAGTGGQSLILTPTDLALFNGDSTNVEVQNFAPGNLKTLSYSATGLPSDSTITFTPVKNPDVPGTDQQAMTITIGPDTPAGVYIVNVTASHSDSSVVQQNFVLVNVDCTPPLILGTGQPAATLSNGSTITVNPVGSLGLHYQWYLGHTGTTLFPVSGATTSSFIPSQPGQYWVRVTNACGSTDSSTTVVTP